MKIKIMIATHKKCWVPKDKMYLPIHVGKEGKDLELGYTPDNTGENISSQNLKFCELTAVYWGWKNLQEDYIGLVHYGRHFAEKNVKCMMSTDKRPFVMKRAYVEKILEDVPVILPKRRRYYIEKISSHYEHTHDPNHLETTRDVLCELCPEYVKDYDQCMERTWAHMFNMFVMRRDYFKRYCAWIFPILFEVEKRVDETGMTDFEKRYVGRISELLLDVWVEHNKVAYKEVAWTYLRKVNFFNKLKSFLLAKFTHKKYENSF